MNIVSHHPQPHRESAMKHRRNIGRVAVLLVATAALLAVPTVSAAAAAAAPGTASSSTAWIQLAHLAARSTSGGPTAPRSSSG